MALREDFTDNVVATMPSRAIDPDGATMEVFPFSTDEKTLEQVLTFLFTERWADIAFGPIIEGAAFEFRASGPPERMGMMDGYLTVHFGPSHFHLCIGPHKGASKSPTPPALAKHRRTARAELFRRLVRGGDSPISWGLRLFNGEGEQQLSIFFPNPFLSQNLDKVLKQPDWSKLALWDSIRVRWLDLADPDPVDRSGKGFRHD
jgi:hypothetical protein